MEPLPGRCCLLTSLLYGRQDERCLHLEGLLRLLLGSFQDIPFVGEPSHAKLRLPSVGEILSCCRAYRTIQLGSLAQCSLKPIYLCQREQCSTRPVAVPGSFKEGQRFLEELSRLTDTTCQHLFFPDDSETGTPPLRLTLW